MPRSARNAVQRLAVLEQQQMQIKARILAERAKLRVSERKNDTRRKIIAGALALEHAKLDPAFGAKLEELIGQYVTRPEDRALFGLHPLPEPQQDRAGSPSRAWSESVASG